MTRSIAAAVVGLAFALHACAFASDAAPQDLQGRFQIELFAARPQIVNPIGLQVDDQGRVFVIESHTHFRPKEYDGPAGDRILLLEDTNADHQADKTTVFREGFTHAMDLALANDGSLYVATRSAIHRLRDNDSDGRADEDVTLIELQTKGDYPHNGLSGLAFDRQGGLFFGFGENLGEAYKLVGSDGTTLTGEAEGGNIYHCRLDGAKLRRVATGFWNPFGLCLDPSGNLFATDNDPDSSPPCRLLHVIEGGDYGYEFRYGRSGLHVFQSWNGELPGTLPMVTGTGEAPCEVIPYDNGLLAASWADNRLEHHRLVPRGMSFGAERTILVSGDLSFRPVGIAVAKDGSLYVSDWASASYELSGQGRIWKLRPRRTGGPPVVPNSPAATTPPSVTDVDELYRLLRSDDPFVRLPAINGLAQKLQSNESLERSLKSRELDDRQSVGLLLAMRRLNGADASGFIRSSLRHRSEQMRFLTLKWIADERLSEFRSEVEQGLQSPQLTRELFAAHLAALERIDGAKIGDLPDPKLVVPLLTSRTASPRLRAFALQMLPADHAAVSSDLLASLIKQPEEGLQLEAIRTISAAPLTAERRDMVSTLAADDRRSTRLRAEAISVLAGDPASKDWLLSLALGAQKPLRDEALRSLVEIPLSDDERGRLSALGDTPEATRLLGKKIDTPPLADTDAWMAQTTGDGDAEAGRRIFFHSKVGYCSRCHRYDGRGNHVGPDLTRIHLRGDRRWLLTAILQPARDVAPGYRQWQIQLRDGTQQIGISLRKGSNSEDYYGADGKPFRVKLADIDSRSEVATSMMPEGLPQMLTANELRNVLAFLMRSSDRD
ncbi:MAG: c-type cytochrome [Planctomycetes bacterium]|nr:c-type cytochrome [Planctomycetota bacterium]